MAGEQDLLEALAVEAAWSPSVGHKEWTYWMLRRIGGAPSVSTRNQRWIELSGGTQRRDWVTDAKSATLLPIAHVVMPNGRAKNREQAPRTANDNPEHPHTFE